MIDILAAMNGICVSKLLPETRSACSFVYMYLEYCAFSLSNSRVR